MVQRHVALLRGINVGRAKRIAMADLRALFEALGYGAVRTLLNSGNVVFDVPRASKDDPAARIEKAIAARLGVTARVTVLNAEEFDVVVAGNPLLDVARDPSRLMVCVLSNPADRKLLRGLDARDWGTDRMALGARVAYVWCPDGILASPVLSALAKSLGDSVTSRNWATVQKLHALLAAGP